MKLRRFTLPVVALIALAQLPALPAHAAGPLNALNLSCVNRVSADGVAYQFCSGRVPSFDGVPLDTDVTIPASAVGSGGSISPRPLLLMLHGWGNSKSDWESDTKHSANPDRDLYNNVWFASRGYTVVNYSARGHHNSCGYDQPSLIDPACAQGWTHLADRRYEIHDAKHLAGLLADAGVAIPGQIGVTGGSYGGGQSWLLAVEGDRVTNLDGSMSPWTSPGLHLPMHLAVAVPKYPWSDLANALVPNGRDSDGVIVPDGNRLSPFGIPKQSYVAGLYAVGAAAARYAPPGVDPTADLDSWFVATNAGEPADLTPVAAQALDQLAHWKSAYYQDALIEYSITHGDQVPVLDIQGWTDDLFPETQGTAMINKIRAIEAAHPQAAQWPLGLMVTDVGHAKARNRASDWTWANQAANAYLDNYLMGPAVSPDFGATARISTCDDSTGNVYWAPTWAQLAPNRSVFASTQPQLTTFAPIDQPAGILTDPIVGHSCPSTAASSLDAAPTSGVWEFPLTTSTTLLGAPALHLEATAVATSAEFNSRVWDVAPGGTRTLVTKGVYRFSGLPGTTSFEYPLQGNGWVFPAGHSLRLEVTQSDNPAYRTSNVPSAALITAVRLTLPVPVGPGLHL